jgi:O-antigen/teichoic acid export membrane protein
MNFKTQALIALAALSISGSVAITTAYMGCGVWALVIQQLTSSVITIFGLYTACGLIKSLKFSKNSFKSLFGFGSNLLAASIYAQIFQNIYNLILGKFYNAATLGFYTRAKRLSDLSSGLIAQILQKVTYPLLCSINDDEVRLISVYRRLIRMAAFIVFPVMTLTSLLAEPLIRTLLGEAWLESVFILQLLAIARITYPISVINMNILNAKGRSDLFLKVDLSKAPVILIILAVTVPFGLKAIIIGQVVGAWIAFFIERLLTG